MRIGEKIRIAREQKGLSQFDVAEAIGISQPSINKIENGKTRKSKYIPDIERFLEMIPEHKIVAIAPSDPSKPVPIMATAEDGKGFLVMSDGAIDSIARPPELKETADAYGVLVSGYDMSPRYRSGELLIVHPQLPPRIEDGVLLFREGEQQFLIREFIRSTPTHWFVRRYGDKPGEETVPRKELPKCHVVWGVQSRR